MPALTRVTRRDRILLLLVALIAALLRLGDPGIVEFRHDEAMLSLKALDFVSGQGVPFTGIPSSVGLPNPPVSVYILALPYALSDNPQWVTLFIAALNVGGVALLWLIAHRYLGRSAGLIAGLAYAFNPWAVLYSRKIWAQDFHTPFILLAVWLGMRGFLEGKRWAQAACLPVLLIGAQIHFAAWALLPVYLWLVWMGRKRLAWRALALSVILAALTLLPFALGLAQTLAKEPQRLERLLDPERIISVSGDAQRDTAQLATGLGLEHVLVPEQTDDLLVRVPTPAGLWWLLGGLALAGAGVVIWMGRVLAPLWLLWVGAPLAVFSVTWTPVYPHYFVASIPALCALIGIGAGFLADNLPGKPLSRAIILAGVGALLLTQGITWRGALRYVDTTYTPGGFGTPLHHLLTVRQALASQRDVLVISDGLELLYDQEPVIWSALLYRSADCVRTITGDGIAVFPAGPFAVLTAPNAPPDPVGSLYQRADEQVFPLRPGEDEYRVAVFSDPPSWNGPALTPLTPARFASGAQLTGFALQSDRLTLEWRLPGRVEDDYHYFGHFLDANGERLGQRDALLWPGRFWCAGDRLLTWVDIELPANTVTLRVGMYTLDGGGFINTPLLDEAGSPVGTWLDIPLSGAT